MRALRGGFRDLGLYSPASLGPEDATQQHYVCLPSAAVTRKVTCVHFSACHLCHVAHSVQLWHQLHRQVEPEYLVSYLPLSA